jgi:outer membrane protein assembly factor BamB
MSRVFIGLLVFCFFNRSLFAQENWPQFRGPGARGVSDGKGLPDRWSATENVLWKRDIPGRGWSSPVVWGDKLFLTSVINSSTSKEAKKGLYFGGDQSKPPESDHRWVVSCLELATGNILWERTVKEGKPEFPIHIKSTYASETPVTDGERIYCCFGNVGIFCFDLEGKEIWRRDLELFPIRAGWGPAASPVLFEGKLFLVSDNEKASYLLALDAKTGSELWKIDRDEKSNWSTPYVWKNDLRTEIVTPGTKRVVSYDLSGNELWSLQGMSSITIATPYEANGLLIVSSGYVLDIKFRPIYAIRPGATGDISLEKGSTSNQHIAWSLPKSAPYNPSTLVYRDQLYVLYDRGTFACFDAKTGAPVYSEQRIPNGKAFTSSPWAYDGKVFCMNEDGVTFVFQAGSEFKLLQENPLLDDDMGMASPAIVGDKLIVRTAARVYCFSNKSP